MAEKQIKNMEPETVLNLAGQVSVLPGQVVSRTLAQNDAVSVTLFAFGKGEEIGTHDSDGDAMATVLEGTGLFTVNGKEHEVKAGESLIMPAKKPHAVFAREAFKMLLIVIFPAKQQGKEELGMKSREKFAIDRDACIGCGLCEQTCPEVFRMGGGGKAEVHAQPDEKNAASAEEAMKNCPASAITEEE